MHEKKMKEMESRARHFGPIRDANGYANKRGECGDLAEIWLRIDGGRIRQASFMTDGCGWSSHCSNIAVSLVEGWKTAAAAELQAEQVLNSAGEVPDDHHHCAELAAQTLHLAIENYNNPPEKVTVAKRIKNLIRGTAK